MFVSSLFLFQPLAAVLHVVNARLFGWTGSGARWKAAVGATGDTRHERVFMKLTNFKLTNFRLRAAPFRTRIAACEGGEPTTTA
jgi:hypothetical protein